MRDLNEAVSSASATLNVMLGILATLAEEDWILYSCDSAKIVYSDFHLHARSAYSILQKEIIRTAFAPKRKIIEKNSEKALNELQTAHALWEMLVGNSFITEKEHTKYFHSGFGLVSAKLPEIISYLRGEP